MAYCFVLTHAIAVYRYDIDTISAIAVPNLCRSASPLSALTSMLYMLCCDAFLSRHELMCIPSKTLNGYQRQ
jgi:hypothetical protein